MAFLQPGGVADVLPVVDFCLCLHRRDPSSAAQLLRVCVANPKCVRHWVMEEAKYIGEFISLFSTDKSTWMFLCKSALEESSMMEALLPMQTRLFGAFDPMKPDNLTLQCIALFIVKAGDTAIQNFSQHPNFAEFKYLICHVSLRKGAFYSMFSLVHTTLGPKDSTEVLKNLFRSPLNEITRGHWNDLLQRLDEPCLVEALQSSDIRVTLLQILLTDRATLVAPFLEASFVAHSSRNVQVGAKESSLATKIYSTGDMREAFKKTVNQLELLCDTKSSAIADGILFAMVAPKREPEPDSVVSVADRTYLKNESLQAQDRHFIPTGPGLVLTTTVQYNIAKVLDAVQLAHPVILEGNTGVGKSATVIEAARLLEHPLIRFNMSANVEVKDFIGSMAFTNTPEGMKFHFNKGCFAEAWVNGYWLLLDELNLAHSNVLSSLETALDSSKLVVPTAMGHLQNQQFMRHKNFRLFATQNPSTFVGRNRLPNSFISRFEVVIMESVPQSEWGLIISSMLRQHFTPDQSEEIAHSVLGFHERIKEEVVAGALTPEHKQSYAEISPRELLRMVNGVCQTVAAQSSPTETALDMTAMLAEGAWAVYGCRYRNPQVRCKVLCTIEEHFRSEHSPLAFELRFEAHCILSTFFQIHARPLASSSAKEQYPCLVEVLCAVEGILKAADTIQQYGMYLISFPDVFRKASRAHTLTEQIHAVCVECIGPLRHKRLRQEVVRAVATVAARHKVHEDLDLDLDRVPFLPFAPILVATTSILSALHSMVRAVALRQPLLLTGANGVGKSLLVRALAVFLNQPLEVFCVTPETEISAFVGCITPEELQWHHGCVTNAIVHNSWLLLDNINEASATVVERLNPVLEASPTWSIPEHLDAALRAVDVGRADNFLIFATMTPAVGGGNGGSSDELSAALYNRFVIMHIPDTEEYSASSVGGLITYYLGETLVPKPDRLVPALVATSKQACHMLTHRDLVRFADCCYRLYHHPLCASLHVSPSHSRVDYALQCATAAMELVVLQRTTPELRVQARNTFFREMDVPVVLLGQLPFLDLVTDRATRDGAREYILHPKEAPARYEFAQTVAIGVLCGLPVLLEGPAATGKTRLVDFLAQHRTAGAAGGSEQSQSLWRLNNSDTTTLQDYLGTWVPSTHKEAGGKVTFDFLMGPLSQSMETGAWFLADELNLADVRVLNGLLPLLEDQRQLLVPGSQKVVQSTPGFAFFATQNDCSYNDRKALPRVLRTRFVEIRVPPFRRAEIVLVLKCGLLHGIPGLQEADTLEFASALADAYQNLNQAIHDRQLNFGPNVFITLREVDKWVSRARMQMASIKHPWHWAKCGARILMPRLVKAEAALVEQVIKASFKVQNDLKVFGQVEICEKDGHVVLEEDGTAAWRAEGRLGDLGPLFWVGSRQRKHPQLFKQTLLLVCQAFEHNQPILLSGPNSCKSAVIEAFQRLARNTLTPVYVHERTETTDLVGQMTPFTYIESFCKLVPVWEELLMRLDHVCTTVTLSMFSASHGRLREAFQVVRGVIQRSMDAMDENVVDSLRTVSEEAPTTTAEDPGSNPAQPPVVVTAVEASPSESDVGDLMLLATPASQDASDRTERRQKAVLRSQGPAFEIFGQAFGGTEEAETLSDSDDDSDGPQDGNNVRNSTWHLDDSDDSDDSNSHSSTLSKVHSQNSLDSSFSYDVVAFAAEQSDSVAGSELTDTSFARITSIEDSQMQSDFEAEMKKPDPRLGSASPSAVFENFLCSDELEKSAKEVHKQLKAQGVRDDCLLQLFNRAFHGVEVLRGCRNDSVMFQFRDGPVLQACKRSSILLLEDYDVANQAVMERLNGLLESSRVFNFTEDPACKCNITLLKDFQVCATAHGSNPAALHLSPAGQSRFAHIHVPGYSTPDMLLIVREELCMQASSSPQSYR